MTFALRTVRSLLLALAVLAAITPAALAQTPEHDPEADKLLKAMRNKVNTAKDLKATFVKTLEMRGATQKPHKTNGTLKFKTGKFKMDFTDQVVVCNGATLWSYLPEEQEITISKYDEKEGFSPDRMFTFSQEKMKTQFNGAETANQKAATKVTLYPVDAKLDYFKVEIWIITAESLPTRLKIWNRNGSIVTYDLTGVAVNTGLADTEFAFDVKKYPGAEVIDNR